MPSTINAAAVAVAVVAISVVCFAGASAAWENSLGMKFVPVPGKKALFCVWETRNRDFRAFKADHDSGKFESHRLNGDEQPVVNVSWDDAKAFCDWLTRTERQKGLIGPAQSYRLPMEWEWSVAVGLSEAKGGTSKDKGEKIATDYPWGLEWPPPEGAGNYSGSESAWSSARMQGYRDNHAVTAPVGSYSPNRLGLFDLGGNVWEWCEDCYDSSQQFRVLRGGSWGTTGPGDFLLSSSRGRGRPGERGSFGGFRVVLSAEKVPAYSSWSDDFSDAGTLADNWRAYGFLASAIDATHPLGKTVSGKDARPEWWQIVDGVLRGQCFPEEKHPPGLRRPVSGKDIRVSCRFKMAAEGQIGISIGGPNPIVEKDFNVAGLHIRPDGITAWDNDVLHPKGSPEAAELKAKGIWNRKFFYAKTEKLPIAPDVWHSLVLKLRGKELQVMLNGKLALTYTTLCGDVPKNDIGLQPGGKSRRPLASWFDDIRVEPLLADK